MKTESITFPEHLFYEGNVRLGRTLKSQIESEEALFSMQKNILSLKEEIDSRRSNYRRCEEGIDSQEKYIKQAITDLRTDTCLHLLEIQKETENLVQLEKAAKSTLKLIKRKIRNNQKIINNEKEKMLNAQNFEITATQYNEVLQEQTQNLKNDILFNNNDYNFKSQITWYSNEYYVLDSKISEISSRIPNYDYDIQRISLKINKKIRQINELKTIKHEFWHIYPEKDDIEISKKKIKHLQKKTQRILDIVREYHEIQKGLISRISNLTTKCVKCDVHMRKLAQHINQLKTKKDFNYCLKFDKMIIDDDKKRSVQIIKNNSDKILQINESIKEQQSTLERQIFDTRSAINGHKGTINLLKQQIKEYSKQQNLLNEQLLEYQTLFFEIDQKYQKINRKIDKINDYLEEIENQKKAPNPKVKVPKIVEQPLRQFQYEIDQIHDESNLKLKLNYVQDQISLLKKKIHQYENNNQIMQQKIKQRKENIEKDQNNVYKKKKLSSNKLKPIIIDLEKNISQKLKSVSKKKDNIKYKLEVINNAQQCIKESEHSPILPKSSAKQKINDIQKWIERIEREILKWEEENIDESIQFYLSKWNEKLPEIGSDDLYSNMYE